MRSLISIADLDSGEIEVLAKKAIELAEGDRLEAPPVLQGKTVGLAFFEPSTRTILSFELATQRLGGHSMAFHAESSSQTKGESVEDTVRTIVAIGADILVVRHKEAGTPAAARTWGGVPVINAGDGVNEHPTQALLDIVTMTRHFGGVAGLRVALVGDIGHSRVANSLVRGLPRLGVELTLVAPADLMPASVPPAIVTTEDFDTVIDEMDVVYMLRVQRERGAVTHADYERRYQLNRNRARSMRPGAMIMHPGPINRGVEITDEVAYGPRSLVLDQVANGVPTRMSLLEWVGEGL